MTGLISGIKRMEVHDGDGIRTTVFFKGCPLKCLWCHNPESISFEKQVAWFEQKCIRCGACEGARTEDAARLCPVAALNVYGTEYSVEDLVETLLQDKPFFDESGGGVTLSGGECLAQPKFAVALARALKERGVSVCVDTCGCVKKSVLEQIAPYTDVFLYDVKAIDPLVHKNCTGKDNAQILSNLEYLCKSGAKLEIRYPLVKGYNDSECDKIAAFLKGKTGIRRVKVLQYHDFAASRYAALGMENTLPNTVTEKADVDRAVQILKAAGLNAVSGIDES